jgi:hypothetical protein
LHLTGDLRDLPRFYAAKHDIDFSYFFRPVRGMSRFNLKISADALYLETVRLYGFKMFIPGNETDVITSLGEPPAYISANST